MHGMTKHEKCNLTKLNGTEIPTFNYRVQVIFLTIKLNVVSMLKQDMGELLKIKWNGDIISNLFPSHSIFNYLGVIQKYN